MSIFYEIEFAKYILPYRHRSLCKEILPHTAEQRRSQPAGIEKSPQILLDLRGNASLFKLDPVSFVSKQIC